MKRPVLLSIVLCAIQTLCLAQSSIDYSAIVKTDDGFAVCGTGDKMVFLDKFGAFVSEKELTDSYHLNDIAYCGNSLLAVGDDGMLILQKGEAVEEIRLGNVDLSNVESLDNTVILGVGQSIVRMSSNLDFIDAVELKISGSIKFLSVSDSGQYIGATDKNEVFCSKDGKSFVVIDFNKEYQSYYKPINITAVASSESSMAIVGNSDEGDPLMFISSDGTVWAQRELSHLVKGTPAMLESLPRGLVYDKDNDRMILLCEDGVVFIVPNCSHCNSLVKTGGQMLRDAAVDRGVIYVVGNGGFVYSSISGS